MGFIGPIKALVCGDALQVSNYGKYNQMIVSSGWEKGFAAGRAFQVSLWYFI
jgi:hypothetical protein